MQSNLKKSIFSSESVGKGHPDKICDQIADRILDVVLAQDPDARSAIEVMASNRLIVIGGELSTSGYVDVVQQAWNVLLDLGYTYDDFSILSNVHAQSSDISQSVNKINLNEIGAGDQGIIFGYATDESPTYMPLAIQVAHALVEKAEQIRILNPEIGIKSDMKSQVSVDDSDPNDVKIDTVLMSIQHRDGIDLKQFSDQVRQLIIEPVINTYFNDPKYDYQVLINPSGRFVIGGPIGDTGLTGRKIIVDTYGGAAKHGGGAFSGKDYTKVDRSGAYAARWVAKNLVAAGVAKRLEVQIAYGIGLTKPLAIKVDHFGTSQLTSAQIIAIINRVFDLSPKGIIDALDLKRPIYAQTACYGHFGKPYLPWEQLNKVSAIQALMKKLTKTDFKVNNKQWKQSYFAKISANRIEFASPQAALDYVSTWASLNFNPNAIQNQLINPLLKRGRLNQLEIRQLNGLKRIKNILKIVAKRQKPYFVKQQDQQIYIDTFSLLEQLK